MNDVLFANVAALGSVEKLARLAQPAVIYLLKGAAIISLCDAAVSSRVMEDTDILVSSSEEYDIVAKSLERMGFAKRRGDSQTYEDISGRGRPFDAHDGLWYAARAELESILSASRRADGLPSNVRTFAPEDLCADIIIHAGQHGWPDERWTQDIEIIARRFGRRAAELGRAKALRYCARTEMSAPLRAAVGRQDLPRGGFIRRFVILGTLEKKAAYAAALLFPSGYFIARRYDSTSSPALLFYRCARPFALLAVAAYSAAAVFVSALGSFVSKSRRLLWRPPSARPS